MQKDEEWQKFMPRFEVFLVDRNSSKESQSRMPKYEEQATTSKNREQGQSQVIGIFSGGEVRADVRQEARGVDDDHGGVDGRLGGGG